MEKKEKKQKKQLLTIVSITLFILAGCSNTTWQVKNNEQNKSLYIERIDNEVDISKESNYAGESTITIEDIETVCQDIYDEALEKMHQEVWK